MTCRLLRLDSGRAPVLFFLVHARYLMVYPRNPIMCTSRESIQFRFAHRDKICSSVFLISRGPLSSHRLCLVCLLTWLSGRCFRARCRLGAPQTSAQQASSAPTRALSIPVSPLTSPAHKLSPLNPRYREARIAASPSFFAPSPTSEPGYLSSPGSSSSRPHSVSRLVAQDIAPSPASNHGLGRVPALGLAPLLGDVVNVADVKRPEQCHTSSLRLGRSSQQLERKSSFSGTLSPLGTGPTGAPTVGECERHQAKPIMLTSYVTDIFFVAHPVPPWCTLCHGVHL